MQLLCRASEFLAKTVCHGYLYQKDLMHMIVEIYTNLVDDVGRVMHISGHVCY